MADFRMVISLGLVIAFLAGGAGAALPRNPGNIDLQVLSSNISLTAGHGGAPRLNDNVSISVRVDNIGDEPAFNVGVGFFYNTTNTSLTRIDAFNFSDAGTVIAAGSSAVASVAWNTSGVGLQPYINYSVWVQLHNDTAPANQSDPDPSNNEAFVNITFLPDVILSVIELTTSTDTPVVGDTVGLLASLGNTGINPALNETVAFYLDNESAPFQVNRTDIPPNVTTHVAYDWNTSGLTDGSHDITAAVRDSARSATLIFKYRTNPYISAISASTGFAHVGDTVLINLTLQNNGTEMADLVTVDFYVDTGGVPVGNLTVDQVPVGVATPAGFSWDTTVEPVGNHTVKARIFGTAREMRTGNITLAEELLPDYTMVDLSVSDTSPFVGDTVDITVKVTNIGDAAPRLNTTVQVLLDSVTVIGTADVPPIAPGELFACSFQWDTGDVTPLPHHLLAQVNFDVNFTEKNDSNNDMRIDMRFQGNIDLAVQAISFSLSLNESNSTNDVTIGQSVWIWVKVANLGTLSSALNTTLSLFLDSSADAFRSSLLYPIAPGHNFTAQYSWDTSGLTGAVVVNHSVRAFIDPLRLNNDSDPANNQLGVNLTVHPPVPGPDLAVMGIRSASLTVRSQDVLAITATVGNIGGKPASGITVRFTYQSGLYPQLIGDQVIAALGPGEASNVTENWTVLVGEGNYTVNIVIDPQNSIAEVSKANNMGSTPVVVLPVEQPVPRLTVTVPNFLPTNPRPGQTVTIAVTISNTGTAPATGINVTLLVGGKSAGVRTIPEIAPGTNSTVTMDWKAVSGTRTVAFRVSGSNVPVLESTAVPVEVKTPAAESPAGNGLAVLVVIVILLVAVVAIIAVGGRKKRPSEEEE